MSSLVIRTGATSRAESCEADVQGRQQDSCEQQPDRHDLPVNAMQQGFLPTDNTALAAARAAIEENDLLKADRLFLDYLEVARNDSRGLADHAGFCLRTGRAGTACHLGYRADRLAPGNAELLNQLGHARLRNDDCEAALGCFRAALAIDPAHAHACYGLALCHRRCGDWTAAAEAFARARAEQPQALPILLDLAEACASSGDVDRARELYAEALRNEPDNPTVLLAHARFLCGQSDARTALALLDQCEQSLPGEWRVGLERVRCLRQLGDMDRAWHAIDQLGQLAPGQAEVLAELGECLLALGRAEAAEAAWVRAADTWLRQGELDRAGTQIQRLLAFNSGSAAGLNLLGLIENAQGRWTFAETAFLKSIAGASTTLDAAANLAMLHERHNRLVEADAIADAALANNPEREQCPGLAELLHVKARTSRRNGNTAKALALLDRADALALSDRQRMLQLFERGRALDANGDFDQAMEAFSQGNAIARATWQREHPGKNTFLMGVEYLVHLARQGMLTRWRPVENCPAAHDMAFLVGFPRSGTTLLNQVLDCHGDIETMEEKPPAQDLLDALRKMPKGYPQAVADFDDIDVDYLRDIYVRSARRHGATFGPKLLVDKFPLHLTMAGLLHQVFPAARFVLALRHPCDAVLSCYMQSFELNPAMAAFSSIDDSVELYVRTMTLWEMYRDAFALRVHCIRYEDVVDDFDGQLQSLCQFLGIEWQGEMREFSRNAIRRGCIDTPSYEQVSRPIYRESRYRWERYRKHLAPHLPALAPFIERYGYSG